jgi:hypothetical protein
MGRLNRKFTYKLEILMGYPLKEGTIKKQTPCSEKA